MLAHFPLGRLPLGSVQADAVTTFSDAASAAAAGDPLVVAAGARIDIAAAGNTVAGGDPLLIFDGVVITLDSAAIAAAGAPLVSAAGSRIDIGQTLVEGDRYGILGELPLGGAIVIGATYFRPVAAAVAGAPLVFGVGVRFEIGDDTRFYGARYGVLGELPLGGAIVDAVTIVGPLPAHVVVARGLEVFTRRRPAASQIIVS